MLPYPVVLFRSASFPQAVFLFPVVFWKSAKLPLAVLPIPLLV